MRRESRLYQRRDLAKLFTAPRNHADATKGKSLRKIQWFVGRWSLSDATAGITKKRNFFGDVL